MRGPHLQSNVTHQPRRHVTNQKRYISLIGWSLRMRRPHPQSHVTFRHHGHLTNKKCYISTFIQCMDPKISKVVT